MKTSKKFYHYFDIPLQHADETILKLMNRKGSHANTLKILEKIREEIPDAIFRTTFMVGFPGETEEDVEDTLDLMKKVLLKIEIATIQCEIFRVKSISPM